MNIFKENLTSKLIQESSIIILNSGNKNPKHVLELGCGNGNITKFLIKNQKYKNNFYCSDISKEAVNFANKNINYSRIFFKHGSIFEPWRSENLKFDIIISDVSSISEPVAKKSPWYKGVVSDCNLDGLKNVKMILNEISNYLSKDGFFLLPIISLSDINKLKKYLREIFEEVLFTKKIYWPMPKFFAENLKTFQALIDEKKIHLDYKFGSYYAFTYTAICSKFKNL